MITIANSITSEDLNIMCDVEILLHRKLEETNGIKDTFNGEEYCYFDEKDKDYEIWVKYWNMVERFIQQENLKKKIDLIVKEEENSGKI